MKNTFAALFNLEKGEGKLVILIFLFSFWIGFPRIFTTTAAQAVFLEKFDAQSLPYVYIFAAFVNVIVGGIYLKLQQKLVFHRLLIGTLAIMIAVEATLNILVKSIGERWPALLFAVWNEAEFLLLVTLFWALAAKVFNVRQGKRLFGLIGMGEVLTGILGGLAIPLIVNWIGTINLLFMSIGGLGAAILTFTILQKNFPEKLRRSQRIETQASTQEKPSLPLKLILKSSYIHLIFSLATFTIMSDYIVSNAFFDRVSFRYPDKDQLASFMGLFYSANSLLSLIIGVFLAGRLLSQFGILFGLIAIPVTVGLHVLPISIIGTVAEPGLIVFCLMVSARMFFRTGYYTLYKPAITTLYQPLITSQKERAQGFVDSVVAPVATGVTGIFLLFFNKVLYFNAVQLSMVITVISILWGICAILTRQQYTQYLSKALARRTLSQDSFSLQDSASLHIIQKALQSAYVPEVIYAIGMLEEGQPDGLDLYFQKLLHHPEPPIRQEILQRIEHLHQETLLKSVVELLQQENNLLVQAAAIKTIAALDSDNATERLQPYLESRDEDVQSGAIVALLKYGGISGVLAAGTKLIQYAESSLAAERRFAAQVLGEVSIQDFYQPLIKLLADTDKKVQQEAIAAAGKIKHPRLWPKVIEHLEDQELRNGATTTLVLGGDGVVLYLESSFSKDKQNQDLRIRIAQICGKLKGQKSINFLRKHIEFPDEDVRHPILLALKACEYQCSAGEAVFLKNMVFAEVKDAAWAIAASIDIGASEYGNLLQDALMREVRQNRERIFLLLSFIYGSQRIAQAWQSIKSEASEKKAYALELIDNIIPQEFKLVIFPVIEDISLEERMKLLNTKYPQKLMGVNARLKEIVARSDQWTTSWAKCCAVYMMGKLGFSEFYGSIVSIINNPAEPPLLLEHAIWALGQISPDNIAPLLNPLLSHRSSQVAQVAQYTLDQTERKL
ncbi:MAG: HEAT repeat domain-containing protein [SAR324 cluster bacterium]|nr:HEAT repeat domain-containing protein [SAR324 cluster bacterium]